MDSDDDQDTIKQALLETNPYLLAVTVLVSLAHTVFEFLAFKNDIQFWRTRKSMEGLSVRSVLFNVLQSTIVFLYICDNDSSFIIKISIGIGLLIELWKIPKCMNVAVDWNAKFLGIFPTVRISDKGTYVESSTKVYDQMAFKYLSWVMFPLLFCYSIYSLIYEEQKGWYSWVLSMLYGFLLMTGFIMYVLMKPKFKYYLTLQDDPTVVHQLQAEECRSFAVENADLQVHQHVHRRPFCLCHPNAE